MDILASKWPDWKLFLYELRNFYFFPKTLWQKWIKKYMHYMLNQTKGQTGNFNNVFIKNQSWELVWYNERIDRIILKKIILIWNFIFNFFLWKLFQQMFWYSCKLSLKASKCHVTGHQSRVDFMPITSLGFNHSDIVFMYVWISWRHHPKKY